ncbi:MAG: hypothetical protein AAB268_02265 [Elusimicrobiota bacterium]
MPNQRTSPAAELTLYFSARRIRRGLLLIALVIVVVSLGARLIQPGTHGLARLVDVDAERSFPTWYSSLVLAASSLLLGAASWVLHRSNRREFIVHWMFLSATFGLLSADEIVGLHESMNSITHQFGRFTGYLRFAWVIPAGIGVFIFGLAYLRFLAALPLRRRNQFVAAGAIYVLGAVGMEMICANIADSGGRTSVAYLIGYNVEELLEIGGIALFNAALIEHLAGLLGPEGLRLRFSAD